MNSIVALTGLEFECTHLAQTTRWYSELFGLEVCGRTHGEVSLKGAADPVRQLTFTAGKRNRLTGLVFEADAGSDLEVWQSLLAARGTRILRAAPTQLAFHDPDGTEITVCLSPGSRKDAVADVRNKPLHVSHLVLNSPDGQRLVRFYVEMLGLRVSDLYERGLLTMLRCHQPQHHCLGIAPAGYSGINHFAMECGTIDAVMMGLGRMKRAGVEAIWGPGRHGPGGNVFCYFEDPNGFVAELTCELLSIPAGEPWVPKEWARTPENANVWGTGGPSPRAVKLMSDNPPA